MKHLLFILNLLLPVCIFAQKVTINGYVSDKESGERLINANIYDKDSYTGTTANNYGYYSISLPEGRVTLITSFIGYTPQELTLDLNRNTTINIELEVQSGKLDEVTVLGNKINKVDDTQMSMISLPVQKLQKIPMILGEADVLKVIQLLPGVQSGTEGTSGIYVRGGGPDQNLFLLDGVPVYNASHLFGFFSVFNPDAIKTVKLYKGGFPARFGGRLSSVVDVGMKDGNMKEFKGNFSIGLISSKLELEGPIKKDKTSFMISARRSYADLIAKPILAIQNKSASNHINGSAYFHDFNLKVNHIFSNRSRLYLSGYHGRDYGGGSETSNNSRIIDPPTEESENYLGIGWGNTLSSLRWNYLLTPKLFSNTSLNYNKFFFNVESDKIGRDLVNGLQDESYYRYKSSIQDITAKVDFDYFPSPNHAIKFGASLCHHHYTPGVTNTLESYSIDESINKDSIFGNRELYAKELATYIEDEITISPKLKTNIGLHLSVFNVDGVSYFRPQPRVSVRYKVSENWSLKASYSRMAQHVHLLTTSNIDLPTDLWVPVTKDLEPPISDQLALGTAIVIKPGINLTVEGFYKKIQNIIAYKEGASFLDGGVDWENKVEKGKGHSYGIEFLLEKTIGKTTGWIGYTLSKTEHQFENINFGRPFPAKYDRRHDISVVLTHKFSDRFDIGGTWVYSTGNAVSLSLSKYPINDIPYSNGWNRSIQYYSGRNNYRMPAYHRMDIGMNFHKQKKHGIRTWSVSVYNAYNQKNPFMLMWLRNGDTVGYDTRDNMQLMKLSIFPVIPTVSYSFKF